MKIEAIGFVIEIALFFIAGWYFMDRFKKDIKKETAEMMNGKVKEAVAQCEKELATQMSGVHETLAKIETNLQWIIKRMNGGTA